MTAGAELAEFVADLSFDSLPEAVVDKAKGVALHSWAVQAACSRLPWSLACHRHVLEEYAAGPATIVGHGDMRSVTGAVLANGTFGHGFELDDNHAPTTIKGGCVAVPAALAVGESLGASGRDLVTAIVGAFEVMIRAGLASWDGLRARRLHPTGALGPLGAATVAGKLLGLDHGALVHALGGAVVRPVGSTESPPEGRGEIKRTFAGEAAAAGVRATMLAAAGVTGPSSLFDAYLTQAYGVEDPQAVTADVGDVWHILDVHYKVYAQDGFIQPVTQALAEISAGTELDPGAIEEIWIGTNEHAAGIIGRIREPRSLADAQYSASFSTALFLTTGGAGLPEYTGAELDDEHLLALGRKVRIEVDDEVDADYRLRRPRGAKVRVRLRDGSEHRAHVQDLRALSEEELLAKIRSLAAVNLDDKAVEALVQHGRTLDRVADVSLLQSGLINGAATTPVTTDSENHQPPSWAHNRHES